MCKYGALIIVFLLFSSGVFGQALQRNANIPVKWGNDFLAFPWAGGINDGQFSTLDVNGDGIEDLFVFDRVSNRRLVFVQSSDVQGQSYYFHAPQFQSAFPQGLNNWVLLRDFNCDGLKDIYTNFQSGILLYENTTDETGYLSFTPVNNLQLILASYDLGSGPFTAPLYCMSVDIPSIDDIDGDGDMDIITNTESSSGMYFYKSMQVENGDCQNPQFICANRCYGMVSEASESASLFIGNQFNCTLNVADPRSTNLHTGGTILTLDLNDNGIHDIVVGDVTEANMAAIYLEDTPSGPDSAYAVELNYPSDQSVQMHLFPAAYYEDVTNDGVKDLLISPNALFGAEDRRSVALYINQGTNSLPNWMYVSNDFLQGNMIDVGIGAHPVAVDIDGDGDQDLVIASRTYDTENLMNKSYLHLLRNDTLDGGEHYFNWVSSDWLGLSAMNWQSIFPSFGDWDADGDLDMMVGELNGFLHAIENIGSTENFVAAAPVTVADVNGSVMDLGQSTTPQLVDLNVDGAMDLVVGEKNGNVNYFKNVGTNTQPQWSLVTDSLAGAMASNYLGVDGYSVPFAQLDEAGGWNLFLGTERGFINQYHFETASPQIGTLVVEDWEGIREGDRSSISMADITGDGSLDLLYGHSGGGIALYTGDSIIIDITEHVEGSSIRLMPNPGTDVLHIQFPPNTQEWRIWDVSGKCLMESKGNGAQITLSTSSWSQGMYFIQAIGPQKSEIQRWIKW